MSRILNGPYGEKLRQAGQFFMKEDKVYGTMRRLASRLQDVGIDYAIVGGMALAEHGFLRVTHISQGSHAVEGRSCLTSVS